MSSPRDSRWQELEAIPILEGLQQLLSALDSLPRIPVRQGDLTTGGVVALVATLAVTLVGAMLGGAFGMRFHRRVDRAESAV